MIQKIDFFNKNSYNYLYYLNLIRHTTMFYLKKQYIK